MSSRQINSFSLTFNLKQTNDYAFLPCTCTCHLLMIPPPSIRANSTLEEQTFAFSKDPRVYFSRETNSWRIEDDEGSELEFEPSKGVWVAVVRPCNAIWLKDFSDDEIYSHQIDEEVFQAQQAAYSLPGVDEHTPAAPVLKRENKKRKKNEPEDYTSATTAGPSSIKRGKTDPKADSKPAPEKKSKNTAVYVSGLPLDTNEKELYDRFSRCGVIEEDDQGEHKIKMYASEDDGSFSGEALVVFFKEDSVTLAVNLMDDAELRLGERNTVMSVKQAEFGHKNTQGSNGASKPRRVVDKKKATKRIGKMQKYGSRDR